MTDDDLPDEYEFRREMARVDGDFASARRFLSALHASDHQALADVMCEIVRSERGSGVLMALACQALDFGRTLEAGNMLRDDDDEPITLQAWLDRATFVQLQISEADKQALDDELP